MAQSHRLRAVAFCVALGTAASILATTGGPDHQVGAVRAAALPNALHEAAFERSHGGEGSREGPGSPAAEEVGDRAYPRSYVDDRLAVRSRNAYQRLPAAGRSSTGRRSLRALAPATPWTELGPVTPNVPGTWSQFFDPTTLTGPSSQESGRVTALAIDPACTSGNCRMWVAAAGGGIWRTGDALAAHPSWTPPPVDMPTTAFGSLYFDSTHNVLYAGSGEPNGSSDSEAGLGLYRSTDSGATWTVVPGSAAVATNRSIGAIAIDPNDATGHTILIGTDLARHGMSATTSGRRTPPSAPTLGVYRSTDNGATFTLESSLSDQTAPNPNPSADGADYFQGGITKLEFDPNNANELYAGVFGYGIWRADQSAGAPTWEQVFITMNQNANLGPHTYLGDTFGDRTEFDLVDLGATTRAYVGDASDDWETDTDPAPPDPPTPNAQAWRVDDIGQPATTLVSGGANIGWTQLSSSDRTKNGFAVYDYCQNGQCGYDNFVAHPPGASADTVWFGGSMNYDELPAYDQYGLGAAPRSNGRAVIRSINAGNATVSGVTWQDMTAVLNGGSSPGSWGVLSGIHPDLHAIAFANSGNTTFIGSDGGVVRIDTASTIDQHTSCDHRGWSYTGLPDVVDPLDSADLARCYELLTGVPASITPINDGLRTLQFQSVSANPGDPTGTLLGGTQDNGTWSFSGSAWTESAGGDGGQSGFDATKPAVGYHNYYDATPEVNFHSGDPTKWLAIYDPLQASTESRGFYTPFQADPKVSGRVFTGLQHVWRTDDNGGTESYLVNNGCYAYNLDVFRTHNCGDWFPIGEDLTSTAFRGDRTGNYVVQTVRAPSDSGTLWAATRTGRLFVSSNADAAVPTDVKFHRIDTPSTPGRFVSGIAVDPANANHAWVSYSGYNAYTPDTPGHVFDVRYDPSTQQATFTDLSYDLGDQPVTGIAEDGDTGDLFAATDFGVATLAPGTSSWVKAGTGLPSVATYSLNLVQGSHILYAATHGRGVWRIAVPAAAPNGGGTSGGGGGGATTPGQPTGAITGPKRAELGRRVTLVATGASPNGAVSFHWQSPNLDTPETGTSITFTPHSRGIKQIVLTISDAAGQSTVVTYALTVVDTTKPAARLSRVATVHHGRPSVFRGSATDLGGVRSLRLSFGDGRRVSILRHGRDTFRVSHRYRRHGTYTATLTALDRSGNRRTVRRRVRVR
jgi:hypothetical protein